MKIEDLQKLKQLLDKQFDSAMDMELWMRGVGDFLMAGVETDDSMERDEPGPDN